MDVRRVRMMAVRRVRMTAAHSRLASLRRFRWLVASDDTQSRLPVALTLSFSGRRCRPLRRHSAKHEHEPSILEWGEMPPNCV